MQKINYGMQPPQTNRSLNKLLFLTSTALDSGNKR